MNVVRSLSFELNRTCNMSHLHPQCPISHPERYKFGYNIYPISDEIIIEFYKWCKFTNGFRGQISWHMYSEPTLVMPRIRELMHKIKLIDPQQPFSLTTNSSPDIEGFEIVHFTDYEGGDTLDDRILSALGNGLPYSSMPRMGRCDRGTNWEIPIDYFGNWCLCCADWRCEESIGNILFDNWDCLYTKYKAKSKSLAWFDESTYLSLPRMCRSCMQVTPHMRQPGSNMYKKDK